MPPRTPWRQTWALCRKNLTITLHRCWLSTLIRAYVLPILFIALLLEIPNLSSDGNGYGVGAPAKVATLAESMKGSAKPLAIIGSQNLGPDFPTALARLTGPLDKGRVLRLESESQIPGACAVDFHGKSNCHAVLIFHESPGSRRANGGTYSGCSFVSCRTSTREGFRKVAVWLECWPGAHPFRQATC